MRKWISPLLIAVAYLASALLLGRLPGVVTPDWSALFPFAEETRPGSRTLLGFMLPTVALALWLLFRALRSSFGEKISRVLFRGFAPEAALDAAAIKRFEATYELIAMLIVAFVVLMHVTLLGLAAGAGDWLAHVFAGLVGLGIAAAGNVMPRLRPNPIMGVRTRKTLNDPLLWTRTHRLFGALFIAAGVLTIVLAIAAVEYALVAGFAGILVSCLIVLVYVTAANRMAADDARRNVR